MYYLVDALKKKTCRKCYGYQLCSPSHRLLSLFI